jgi:hypothetical protein
MIAPAPVVLNFKALDRNSLRGFFDVELPSGLILVGCQLHESHGKYWVGMPARPWTKPDGTQSYVKIVDFVDKATAARFQQTIAPLAVAAYERAKGEVAA